MAILRDHEMRKGNPHHFRYLISELLDFVKEFEMGAFYRKKTLDYWNHAATHYAIKLRAEGSSVTLAQVTSDEVMYRAAYEHCATQVEALLIELLRYQQWSPQPFKQDV